MSRVILLKISNVTKIPEKCYKNDLVPKVPQSLDFTRFSLNNTCNVTNVTRKIGTLIYGLKKIQTLYIFFLARIGCMEILVTLLHINCS